MTTDRRIPRVLRQTISDVTKVDPAVQAERQALMARNPGWRFELWDDAEHKDFIARHFPDRVVSAYQAIDPAYGAARADLWRYLVTWLWGGVYLDLKSTVTVLLDGLIRPDDRMLLSHWQNGPGEKYEQYGLSTGATGLARGEFQQWFVMAEPRHPFLTAAIEGVVHRIETYWQRRDHAGILGALRLTGPIAYTRAMVPYLDRHPWRLIDSEAEGIVYSIFFPASHHAAGGTGKAHYSTLTTPVVMGPQAPRLLRRALRKALGPPSPGLASHVTATPPLTPPTTVPS